jgi:SAM-dependent methyltransferase
MTELSLGEFEFYWQISESGFSRLPNVLPFSFGTREALPFLLSRTVGAKDIDILNDMYTLDSNVGYLQDSNSLGVAYGHDLKSKIAALRFSSSSAFSRVLQPKVLEIGCGGALVLRELASEAMECVGIDPSPIARDALSGSEIELVADFFPNQLDGRKFDFVFCADVLEHMEDPLDFLVACGNHLVEGGLLLVSVPDCTRSIETGDVSMALHQHLSYFDTLSLKTILEKAGFAQVTIEAAKYGGSLYGTGVRLHSYSADNSYMAGSTRAVEGFFDKAATSMARVQQEIKRSLDDSDSVGIYVPLRGLPYLGNDSSLRQAASEFRFFDDTPTWQGKRIQERLSRIENFSQLVENPVSNLFVMSLTFGEVISRKVLKALGSQIRVVTLDSMLD